MALPMAAATQTMSDDPLFRRAILALRWLMLGLYVNLVLAGILDLSPTALAISGSIIGAYDAFHTVLEVHVSRTNFSSERLLSWIRQLDVVMITVAMVALHDVKNPVWSIYFLSIVGAAHFIDRRQMIGYVGWVCVNYYAFAAITVVLGHDVAWPYAIVVSISLVLMGLNASILAGGEQRLREVMHQAATTDSLTGLANRHYFREYYVTSLEQAIADRVALALILLDVDNFKQINDRDGHPAGDDKLRDVARALEGAMRANDLVARYGGDEFIVVAPETCRGDALGLAERLRLAALDCGASMSIGVAMFPEDASRQEELIEAADAALCRAKQAGRNCVRGAVAA